ncbi:hypothetical protein C0Q70_07245 [Pomacea canaliculata]|uniref:Uncharacterized protein n=1 Tax=Pomacea canaliculata TaxID=400727 RepID=A0A2T7PEI0_POMCA|nr:hypothetical protein C0Q70_07245 [Pomacea canaliculata]
MNLLIAFIAWTVSSYACHHTAKVFLTEVSALTLVLTPVRAAAVLSLVQLLCCCLVTKVSQDKSVIVDDAQVTKTTTKDDKFCYYVAMTMHVLSTFLTNWSLARMEAASTLAIKLTEPMVSAIVQWMWLREGLNCHVCVSLPLVVGGALVFISDEVTHVQKALTFGVILAMASNVLLAVRNVAIKGLHSGKLNVSLRWMGWNRIGVTAGVSFLIIASSSTLAIRRVLSPGTDLAVTSLLLSGAFHVTYSLISTSVILRVLDVVSHAMANVIKRMLVVALLYVSGSRSASGVNAAGLAVASVGLAVYVRGKAAVKAESWRCCPVGANIKGHVYRKMTASNGRCQVLAAALISAALCLSLTSVNTLRPLHLTLGYLGADDDQQSLPLTPETQSAPFGLNWPGPPHNATLLSQWAEFLSLDYTRHPFDTDRLAPTLHTNDDLVWEMQRLHVRVLTSLLGGRRHAMLMDFATYENKGDPAITAGQVALLKRLNVTIVFSCSTDLCNDKNLTKARRGLVVITDRLHGHILSVLLGIPHVLIDNPPYFKLSSFRRSWTAGLSNTVLVTTGEEALEQAQQLLQRYESSLPSIMTYWEAKY